MAQSKSEQTSKTTKSSTVQGVEGRSYTQSLDDLATIVSAQFGTLQSDGPDWDALHALAEKLRSGAG